MLYCYWGLYTIWSTSTSTGPDPPCWNCSLFATGWKHPLCHSNTVILHIWSMCFPIRGSHQLDRLTQIWVIGLHHAIIAEHPVVVKRSNEWYLVCCGTSRTYSFIMCFSRFLWGLESAWRSVLENRSYHGNVAWQLAADYSEEYTSCTIQHSRVCIRAIGVILLCNIMYVIINVAEPQIFVWMHLVNERYQQTKVTNLRVGIPVTSERWLIVLGFIDPRRQRVSRRSPSFL